MNNNKISIIVPFYNIERCVEYCLESLLIQRGNFEIICVDDGSTDNTGGILDKYSMLDNVKVFHKKNGGLSDARNYGIEKASGEYITFVDGDDVVHPKYIELLSDAMAGKNGRLVIGKLQLVSLKNVSERNVKWKEVKRCKQTGQVDTFIKLFYGEIPVSACAKLVPREAYYDIKFPIGVYSEEVATVGDLIKLYDDIVIMEEPIYGYVMRKGSSGKRKLPYKNIIDASNSFEKLIESVETIRNTDNDLLINDALLYASVMRKMDICELSRLVEDDKQEADVVYKSNISWIRDKIPQIILQNNFNIINKIRVVLFSFLPFVYFKLLSIWRFLRIK